MAVASDALSSEGRVLDRYRPLRPLGSGGSGSVWLAHDDQSGRQVALKIVARQGKAGPRAEREAAAAARLRHERCQRAYDLASDEEHVYIAYEYVAGRTLREAMRRGELTELDAVEAAAQVADGLAHAHTNGIVHRDVKPANILLADGPNVSVRLLDFGLAQIADGEELTATGDVPGTLAYIAPERLKGDSGTEASDVWSLGVILWEALAGRHPFAGDSLVETAKRIASGAPSLATARPDLPRRIVRAVDGSLARDPARRPSAATLARALRQPRPRPEPAPDQSPVATQPPWRADAEQLSSMLTRLRPAAERLLPALFAALAAGFGAAVQPFYPAGWPFALGMLAGALMLVTPRISLALALAVPFFPLGNTSAGLAIAYAAVAATWTALFLREPRHGTTFVLGPLLAVAGALGLVPLALLGVRHAARRFALGAASVAVSGIVAGLRGWDLPLAGGEAPHRLVLAATPEPLAAATVLGHVAVRHPDFAFRAIVVGAVAAALPFLRRRGAWASALAGAPLLVAALVPAPSVATLPLVVGALVTTLALEGERRSGPADP